MTFEYVLLAGVNDPPEHARELATLLAPLAPALPRQPDPGEPDRRRYARAPGRGDPHVP